MSPCCGGSLQTRTKIIAILDLVFSVLFVFVSIALVLFGGILGFGNSAGQNDHFLTKDESLGPIVAIGASFGIIIVIVIFVAGILSIILSSLLLSGANKRNRTRCMIWFVVHAIFFVLSLVGTISAIFSEGENKAAEIVSSVVGNLIFFYFLWVVWAFMSEIKKEGVEVEFQIPRVERRDHKTWA